MASAAGVPGTGDRGLDNMAMGQSVAEPFDEPLPRASQPEANLNELNPTPGKLSVGSPCLKIRTEEEADWTNQACGIIAGTEDQLKVRSVAGSLCP